MSGSISIIMSNEDLSCPVNYLYFRLNQEEKKPNSTVLKCRNNVSFATQVGKENEITQQQQQPLQYSSQPLAISPVGLEWGWHRFVVKADHGGSHLSRTLESESLSQPCVGWSWHVALFSRSARGHVAAPPPCWLQRPLAHVALATALCGCRSCGVLHDTLGRGAGGHPQGGPMAHMAACHPGHGARPAAQGPVGPPAPWAPLTTHALGGQGQPSERILPYGRATYCKSCHRHVLPSMTDVASPNSEQLWPSALWRKETVLRVQAAQHPPWKCPPLLSSLQQTCLHCSLTFFFLYFYFCMSFAFQIL